MSLSQASLAGHHARADLLPRPASVESRALVGHAVPIMLIALVNMGMSLTDTVMVAGSVANVVEF